MDFIHWVRGWVMPGLWAAGIVSALLGLNLASGYFWATGACGVLILVGFYDRIQRKHAILRNYPVLGHLRFLMESAGPEMHQYFVESNTSGRPFDRDQRSLVYRRAKGIDAVKPFGTELDVYGYGYGFISHSACPRPVFPDAATDLRVTVGGPDCKQPYSASILNISAMSFGALSARAILALNRGAKKGGFAHDTGEGGLSRYHAEGGGDLIWQVGTGYFGCRASDGTFDPGLFAETASSPQVKMIEIKMSQGAKPGHGGILPAAKVTKEIAEARKVPMDEDCMSPPGHSAFSTPTGLLNFVASLRDMCDGKPVGFKLCIGDPREFFAICKAMVETGITPDFITVDGAEGGTGAAPQEFSDNLGFPLREGLLLVHNALVGVNLRDRVRIAASGKTFASYKMACAVALGADWCNVARGFMFSVGCIQSQMCHTNLCPVGVATQSKRLQKALVVDEKAERAYQYHKNTVQGLAETAAACGIDSPADFKPYHLYERVSPHRIRRFDQLYDFFEPGQLLEDSVPGALLPFWKAARADTFER
ncbi:MAG: FMN-binding glutamate synthase family protein [Myxococcota bacterium]